MLRVAGDGIRRRYESSGDPGFACSQVEITNTEIVGVISNNPGAYALERGKRAGIAAVDVFLRRVMHPEQNLIRHFLKAVDSLRAGSDRACRIPGSDSAGDDPEVPKPDHQYPSVTDSVVLRNRLLWAEGA